MRQFLSIASLVAIVGLGAGPALAGASEVTFDTHPTILFVEKNGELRPLLGLDVKFSSTECVGNEPFKRNRTTAGNHTCIDGNHPAGADFTATRWDVFCEEPGRIQLKLYRREGNEFVLVSESGQVEMPSKGKHTFSFKKPIRVRKGDLVGFYLWPEAVLGEGRGGTLFHRTGHFRNKRSPVSEWTRGAGTCSIRLYGESFAKAWEKYRAGIDSALVEVRAGSAVRKVALSSLDRLGELRLLGIPAVEKPTRVQLTLSIGDERVRRHVEVKPEKKWRVYLVEATHVDIGYTGLQTDVATLLSDNIDRNIAFLASTADRPEGSRPKWNFEAAWQIEQYAKLRPPEKVSELMKWVRSERCALQAFYANELTGLCSAEELVRLLYPGRELERDHGVSITSAMVTDAPTHTWFLPTVLASAGIKYLSVGQNGSVPHRRPKSNPFYWVGPDGSEVLVAHSLGYARCAGVVDNLAALQNRINSIVGPDCPYDAVLLHGIYSDNHPLMEKGHASYHEKLLEWNSRYAYPKLICATAEQYFQYMESKYADRIPHLRGDWGADWEDGAASSSAETALNRETHELLDVAERLATICSALDPGYSYPAEDVDQAYRHMLLYDEHTWGAWCSVSQPDSDQTRKQWKIKSGYARQAHQAARHVLDHALAKLASKVSTAPGPGATVMVFNPDGEERTAPVNLSLPSSLGKQKAFNCIDRVTSAKIPCQRMGDRLCFVAQAVPALGYKTFRLVPTGAADTRKAVTLKPNTIENNFYRVTFDTNTGGLTSIYDKELKRELLDGSSPYRCNQYIYDTNGVSGMAWRRGVKGRKAADSRFSPETAEVSTGGNGPVFGSMTAKTKAKGASSIEHTVILYGGIKRVDIVNRIAKDKTYDVEELYYAFPFSVESPAFHFELGGAIINGERDMFPCANRNWISVQRWVDVSNDKWGVTWAPVDAPLVTPCSLSDRWMQPFPPKNGTLFSFLMTNVWATNYRAGQGGDFTFRYAITSHKGPLNRTAATCFGRDVARPLVARLLAENQAGPLPEKSWSFGQIDGRGVVLQALKCAEDGDGLVVRLRDVSGANQTARLNIPAIGVREAIRANAVEENLGRLSLEGSTVAVPLKANGIATLRLRGGRP